MTRYFGVHTLEGEWHSLLPRYVLLADRVEGKKILDVGCGTGIGSSLLLELGAESVNAVDHRPEVLELARVKHAKQGLNFHVMFWEELDFPDDTFDMVLCLDPTSPVTDPSLLIEIQRVLNPGGEYVCAIERRTVDGIETLLPRYGYSSAGEEIDLTPSEERVPQLGQLEEVFETIVSVVQRPRYSFVFDFPGDDEHTMRRSSGKSDESGLWVGEDLDTDAGSTERTDKRAGRWLSIDRQLTQRDGDPAAVELLFCGDEHMPPPSPREVEMPYRSLVDRLHQLFSDLQLRQHPAESSDNINLNPFEEREQTSEFRAPSAHSPHTDSAGHQRYTTSDSASTTVRYPPRDDGWRLLQQQLNHMTDLYNEVRADMQNLFVQTRKELAERDRYIEQLVDTFHRWRRDDLEHRNAAAQSTPREAAQSTPREEAMPTQRFELPQEQRFDRTPTTIFKKPGGSDFSFGDSDDLGDASDDDLFADAQSLSEESSTPVEAVETENHAEGASDEEGIGDEISDHTASDQAPEDDPKDSGADRDTKKDEDESTEHSASADSSTSHGAEVETSTEDD